MKTFLTMLAITDTGACPTITKDSIDVIPFSDFSINFGHDFCVVGPTGTRYPKFRHRPAAAASTVRVNSDPIWMSLEHVLAGSVGINSSEDHHIQLTTCLDQLAETIPLT